MQRMRGNGEICGIRVRMEMGRVVASRFNVAEADVLKMRRIQMKAMHRQVEVKTCRHN
jgi:hypothetical protein